MIGILTSWLLILFSTISFGNILISFSNLFCKIQQPSKYSIVDTIFLGMCCLLIPLSIISLFYPCNFLVLIAMLLVSILYWALNTKILLSLVAEIKRLCKRLTWLQYCLFAIIILSFLLIAIWIPNVEYDPRYYHYQNIAFMEQYKVIPGLANLEDRFGFNSNYLLLSAIFTLRNLFGVPIHALQSFVFVVLAFWVLKEAIVSNFDKSRICLLIVFSLLFYVFWTQLSDTSTDILPSLLAFYIVAKYVLYPQSHKNQILIFTLLPVTIVTFKLSYALFAIIAIPCLWQSFKTKEYKLLSFIFSASGLIFCLWMVRNVIVSGYLIYPLYEIDLFSFDWQIPRQVVEIERGFIKDAGDYFYDLYSRHIPLPALSIHKWIYDYTPITALMISGCFLSPIIIFCLLFSDRKNINKRTYKNVLFILFVLYLNFGYWLVSAPAFRFIAGVACGILLITLLCVANWCGRVLNRYSLKIETVKRYGSYCILVLPLTFLCFLWNYKACPHYKESIEYNTRSTVLYKPLSYINDIKVYDTHWVGYEEYLVGDILIYMKSFNTYNEYIILDKIPSAVFMSPDSKKVDHGRILDIHSIENRGERLEDGFRPKKSEDLKIKKLKI